MKNLFSLEGKVALVTGAAYGIGFAMAKAMADAGARIAFNCRSEEHLQTALKEYEKLGILAKGYICDVTKEEEVGRMVADIEASLGTIDILVNNAGVTRDDLIVRMTEEEYDTVMDTNLKGAFHMIRHLSRNFMKQRSGKIINISSVSGVIGNAGQANYAASKAGLIGLTKSVARELASRGVCVNAVAPGFIGTEMTEAMPEQIREKAAGQIPLGRMGSPADVAGAVLFLAGAQSDYITGQVLCVDGGMAM